MANLIVEQKTGQHALSNTSWLMTSVECYQLSCNLVASENWQRSRSWSGHWGQTEPSISVVTIKVTINQAAKLCRHLPTTENWWPFGIIGLRKVIHQTLHINKFPWMKTAHHAQHPQKPLPVQLATIQCLNIPTYHVRHFWGIPNVCVYIDDILIMGRSEQEPGTSRHWMMS